MKILKKVTELRTKKKVANEGSVEVLKRVLVKAEAGEISGIALAVTMNDKEHTIATEIAGDCLDDLFRLAGALLNLQARVLRQAEHYAD